MAAYHPWHLPKELLQSFLVVAAQLAKRSVHPASADGPAIRAVWLVFVLDVCSASLLTYHNLHVCAAY